MLIARFIARKSYKLFQKQTTARGLQTQLIEESLSQESLIQSFNAQEQFIANFTKGNESYADYSQEAIFYSSTVNPATRFVNALIYAMIVGFGAARIINGSSFTVGQLVTFLNYVNQYTKPFNDISSVMAELQSALACAERLYMILDEKELVENYIAAQNEAKAAFGNPDVYIEKYVEEPRHVEIQVVGDKFGNVVHLGERDCSIQRRHQKLIEESPSAGIDAKTREKMGKFAAKLAKGIGYDSVGTLEFLVDKNMNFYFMEMNTRIQVEHTVSEEITGVDLIKEQIRVAAGEKLSVSQKDINIDGHVIECRINAEDSENGFLPSSGILETYIPSGGIGVRIDSHSYQNYEIPPYYDSMIAKLIVKGKNREEAIARMKRALKEFIIEGVDTTIPFHLKVLDNQDFKKGTIYTNFIETHFKEALGK